MKGKLLSLLGSIISSRSFSLVQAGDIRLDAFKFFTPLAGISLLISGLATLYTLPAQAAWQSGYYRLSGRPEVYSLSSDDIDYNGPTQPSTLCHVQNPSQMEAFGGFGQVQVVRTKAFMSGAKYTGECKWPNGFYRRASMPEVYRLNDSHICWVISPEMMEAYGGFGQIRVVEDSSDLLAGRKDGGDCQWP